MSSVESINSPPSPQESLKAYIEEPHTTELLTKVWQNVWQSWINVRLESLSCRFTTDEITKLEEAGRMIIIIPEIFGEMDEQNQVKFLARTFPQTGLKWQGIVSDKSRTGAVHIEASIASPNSYSAEYELGNLFWVQNVEGQNLLEYVIGSNFSKLTTGHFFDENGTRSRLTGCRVNYWVIDAHFDPAGQIYINNTLDPEDRQPDIGARTAGTVDLPLFLPQPSRILIEKQR